jgi:hypothetical protein
LPYIFQSLSRTFTFLPSNRHITTGGKRSDQNRQSICHGRVREDLNDLVRDGLKKLRDSKTLTDDDTLRYNRPRRFALQHMGTSGTGSPNSSHCNANLPYGFESNMGPTSPNSASNMRKRVFSDKSRAIYTMMATATAPQSSAVDWQTPADVNFIFCATCVIKNIIYCKSI